MNPLKKYFVPLFSLTLFFILAMPNANAVIVAGDLFGGSAFANGGVFQQLTPPIGPVGNNNHQSNNLFAFNEDQNILIGSDLTVDIGPAPVISKGTIVASHYVFFDPGPSRRALGTVDFDAEILGIFTSTKTLISTDFLANVSANYLSPDLRGLEGGDIVTIDGGNNKRININFTASNPGDYIRVLTARSPGAPTPTVPEPSTLILASLGVGAAVLRRRKK